MPHFVAPMLLEPTQNLPEGPQWIFEVKWDGFRCIATKHGNNVRLFSRNGNDFTDRWPEVADAIARLRAHSLLLDGEIVALDKEGKPCFQKLQNGSRNDCVICFYAFDLLHLDGRDLFRRTLEERKAELDQVLRGSRVRFSASLSGSPDVLVDAIAQHEMEGIVAKRRDSIYEPGKRTEKWVKYKILREGEFIVGAYRPCDGDFDCVLVGEQRDGKLHFVAKVLAGLPWRKASLLDTFSSLTARRCPFVNLPQRTRGRWKDGITAEDMLSFRWLRPSLKVRVGYVERTESGLLRHPKLFAIVR